MRQCGNKKINVLTTDNWYLDIFCTSGWSQKITKSESPLLQITLEIKCYATHLEHQFFSYFAALYCSYLRFNVLLALKKEHSIAAMKDSRREVKFKSPA